MTGIFESHAHYEDEAFDEDRDELLKSLPENGIKYVVDVGSSIDTCHKIIELIPKWDYMYGALGIHPEEIRTVTDEDMEWLRLPMAKLLPSVKLVLIIIGIRIIKSSRRNFLNVS